MPFIEIFISSRNNYSLLEGFLDRNNFSNFKFTNIDDCSSHKQIHEGKNICSRKGINFIPNQGRGLQWAWKTMAENIEPSTKFILWTSHDIFPHSSQEYENVNRYAESGVLDKFGLIGFNFFGTIGKIFIEKKIENQCGILGRAPLMMLPGRGGWYRSSDMDLPWEIYGKPFSIEVPADFGFLINVDLFKKFIAPTSSYHLFNASEDVALNFLKRNIHNVVLPDIVFHHDQFLKKAGGVPVFSANWLTRLGFGKKFFGKYDVNPDSWKNDWGWERNDRESFLKVQDKYQGTLIYEFFNHDYKRGPLKIFNF